MANDQIDPFTVMAAVAATAAAYGATPGQADAIHGRMRQATLPTSAGQLMTTVQFHLNWLRGTVPAQQPPSTPPDTES